jgi:integrase
MKRHLTELTIQRAKLPARGYSQIFDLGYPGLALRIGHGGAKSFEHMYREAGILRRVNLGRWPALTLAEAREKWRQTREAISKGEAPVAKGKGPLFETVIEEWVRRDQAESKASSLYQLSRIIERDLLPAWRGKAITSITKKDDIIPVLNGIYDRSPSSAQKTDAYLRRFFKWCRGQDILMANPMEGLDAISPPAARERVLSDAELAKIWRAASDKPAIRMLILTGARKEEICSLRWSEVNAEKIEIPGVRTKNGKPHQIPLSNLAREILDQISRTGEFVFGGEKPFAISDRAKKAFDKFCGVSDWRTHDIRRTVSTQMNELGLAEPHVVEAVLGHTIKGVEKVYNRARHEAAKREALEAWGAYVCKIMNSRKT